MVKNYIMRESWLTIYPKMLDWGSENEVQIYQSFDEDSEWTAADIGAEWVRGWKWTYCYLYIHIVKNTHYDIIKSKFIYVIYWLTKMADKVYAAI